VHAPRWIRIQSSKQLASSSRYSRFLLILLPDMYIVRNSRVILCFSTLCLVETEPSGLFMENLLLLLCELWCSLPKG